MKDEWQHTRIRNRIRISLPVYVRGRLSVDQEWMEMSHLIDVSPFGARMRLANPTEPGRFLHLTLPMPRSLRCFDHVEDQYRVWSLVRHVRLLPQSERANGQLIEVGVAFAGKRAPASLAKNPLHRYEIAEKPSGSNLWTPKSESEEALKQQTRIQRRETRHAIPVDVTVVPFGAKDQERAGEVTITENISRHGAAVLSMIELEPGRFAQLTSAQYQVSVLAPVRGRHVGPDGVPRLHLEFVGSDWPLEDVY